MFLVFVFFPKVILGASYGNIELKPFGLLDTNASLSIRYLLDENSRQSEGAAETFENRTTWEQDLFLLSRSYVYHPLFLNMELGAGPLLVQQQFDSDAGSNSNNESLLNLYTRFNFLDLKSYPFSLFFRRSHPSITTSLSGRFLTQHDEYGLTGSKLFVGKNANFVYDLLHRDVEGSGLETVLDEDEDRGRFKFTTSYRGSDRLSIGYDSFTRNSASGSLGLPIQESRIEQDRAEITAQNRFGSNRQFSLNQSLVQLKQENESTVSSQQDDLLYTASGRWRNTEAVQSTLNYQFNRSERTGSDVDSHILGVGYNHKVADSFDYNVLANHENSAQTGFDRKRTGLGLTGNYSGTARFGSYTLNASVRQNRTDQESFSDTVQIFDEPVTLVGTTPVDLANEFVIAQSVVVTNSAGTQVFVEDEDYRLIVVGSVTSIQRLIDGNIFDGQTVFVDYEYQTSGTAKFDQFNGTALATANFLRYFNGRVRYSHSDSNVISGELTTPINDFELYELILGVDVPVSRSWNVGAELRHVDRNEEIAPSVQDSFSINASGSIFDSWRVNFGASWSQVDQKTSVEDLDQVNYRVGIDGRLFGLASVGYRIGYLEDTGGSLPRESLSHRFILQGRYRAVTYILQATYSDETLGTTERGLSQVTAVVTRYFR
jgi:hypothetical protein